LTNSNENQFRIKKKAAQLFNMLQSCSLPESLENGNMGANIKNSIAVAAIKLATTNQNTN
jgi:hypothetical protein